MVRFRQPSYNSPRSFVQWVLAREILPPLVSPNVFWMPKLCSTYITTTLPPKPNQHQLFHHNHTTTNITTKTTPQPILPPQPRHNHNTATIIILQPTSPKPHCKQGPNVWSSIFLLCPLKDSGTFILALRSTTTTAAKTHSQYPTTPHTPTHMVINQDKIRNYLPRNKFTCTFH